MAPSRESSPVNGSSSPTSPLQLTPNSKVKALLASFDNDSDEESVSGSAGAILESIIAKKPTTRALSPQNAETPNQTSLPDKPETDYTAEDGDDEEDVIRPVGRMAARMQAAENDSEPDAEADDARERVKRLFMAKSKTPEPVTSDKDLQNSDESDAPVVPRKRKIRAGRRTTPTLSSPRRSASPGLFVSPSKSAGHASDSSDADDLPANPLENERFKNLVERKRQERLDKDAREAEEKANTMAERKRQAAITEEDDSMDDFVEQRLTQQTKPTRKASKKAVEKIAQETQRLSRDMQLTHEPKTRKKFTKADFFKRQNFKPEGSIEEEKPSNEPTSSSPAPHSDIEMHETPPTSPPSHGSDHEKHSVPTNSPTALANSLEVENQAPMEEEEDLPTLEEALASSAAKKLDESKGKVIEDPLPETSVEKKALFKQRPVRIRRSTDGKAITLDDSDSDLEILAVKTPDAKTKKLDTIFDRIPAKQARESHSLQVLRTLAHLRSPGKQNLGRNQKSSVTTSELQHSLQRRARQQAARVKEERIEALKAKGVIVLTAEEREKEMAEDENLMARARREGEEIRKKEKADARKERGATGEHDPFGDSTDDEDWKDAKEEVDVLSGSGSEDDEEGASDASGEEEDDEEDDEDELRVEDAEHTPAARTNFIFDEEADETDNDEAMAQLSGDEEMAVASDLENNHEDEVVLVHQHSRRARKSNVISDDEDEDENKESQAMETPSAPRTVSSTLLHTGSPIAPNSVLRSATKTFIPGLTVSGPAGLGLTQIFAGTMDDSQMDDYYESPTAPNSKKDSLAFLRGLPAPDLPPFVPTMEDDSQDVVVDSQLGASNMPESQFAETQTQGFQLGFSQSQVHGFDSLVDPTTTQFSQYPEATQDAGFQQMTPIRGRFVDPPPSTIDTVVMGQASAPLPLLETPIVKKKGKLRKRAHVVAFSDEEDAGDSVDASEQDEDFEISANVFDVMRKASKKKVVAVDEFDKKTSKAKDMVHEQADESEDEYAGLGGASDDESGGEDEYVKEIIDDEGGKDVDESKLAAFFADRERAKDEKQVEKLYSDITKGMLRRKRGADYDLSDSDDGGEARKRMKRKEFAKMRKALLADERIGKIAENPKTQAFLRAIEDRGSGDELDFLNESAEQDEATDSQMSQGEAHPQRIPNSQPESAMGPPKRKRSDDGETESRAPPHLRRTMPSKKPSNISEIRESLSSLIEDPNAMIADEGSDSEGELEVEGEHESNPRKGEKENRDPFALRRKNVAIIDRISLKRASSSSLSSNTRLAFTASSSAPGFQVPPLLRRATTNSSVSSNSSVNSGVRSVTSATERMAGGAGSDGIKRGGGKNSGVNYFARETERRAAVVKTEKRREQKLFKGAAVRRKAVGGLFGGGKFE